jgi:predicted nucleotidyltransferase
MLLQTGGVEMAAVTDRLLQEMVDVIVNEVHPERIYLFGSCARGEAGEDSDVDLLIVEDREFSPERSEHHEMARIGELLAPYPVAKDILVYSSAEVERRRNWLNHVVACALREGRLLYERP